MAKLMDIKGYFAMSFGYDFNDKDIWEGQILLQDNGWFEGIVVDQNSSYTGDRIVCGLYYPGKAIELFKLAPPSVSVPFVFHGEKNDKGYEGQFEAIGRLGVIPYGRCRIITRSIEDTRGNVDEETKALEERIQKCKYGMMDEFGEVAELINGITMQITDIGTKKLVKQKSKDLPTDNN